MSQGGCSRGPGGAVGVPWGVHEDAPGPGPGGWGTLLPALAASLSPSRRAVYQRCRGYRAAGQPWPGSPAPFAAGHALCGRRVRCNAGLGEGAGFPGSGLWRQGRDVPGWALQSRGAEGCHRRGWHSASLTLALLGNGPCMGSAVHGAFMHEPVPEAQSPVQHSPHRPALLPSVPEPSPPGSLAGQPLGWSCCWGRRIFTSGNFSRVKKKVGAVPIGLGPGAGFSR